MGNCIKILCVVICVLQGYVMQAQTVNIYSKEGYNNILFPANKFYNLTPNDTQAIDRQINYVTVLMYRDLDSAVYLLNDALQKSFYLQYDCGIGAAYCNLAFTTNRVGDYRASIKYYQAGLPYGLRGFRSKTMKAMYYSCMSTVFCYTGNYDSMAHYVYKAEEMIRDYKPRSLGIAKDLAGIYGNIGVLWLQIGNYDKAEYYSRKGVAALSDYVKVPFAQISLSTAIANVGDAKANKGQFDSAEYYYKKSLRIYSSHCGAMIGLAKVYANNKKRPQAVPLLKQAIELTEQQKDIPNNRVAKSTLGIVYYELKQYDKAEEILSYIVNTNTNEGTSELENIRSAYATLASIKAAMGDNAKAYEYQQMSANMADSLAKKNSVVAYDMEYKSNSDQKDKLLGQTQLLIKSKNIWIGVLAGVAILVAVLWLALYRNSKNKQRMQQQKMDALQQEQEITHLKAIIQGEEKERNRMARELHDGIMVQLSTVKMNLKTMPAPYKGITSDDYFHTPYYQQMIQQLEDATKELRQTAHNLMPDMLLAGGLAEAVYYFCKTVKQNTALELIFQQEGDIPRFQPEFELSIYRIIQELVQNVIKHAAAGQVIVQLFNTEDNILAITIEDDGKGFDVETGVHDGMGLHSIKTRVAVLNGTMDIRSELNNGTTVYLEFDIQGMVQQDKTDIHAH